MNKNKLERSEDIVPALLPLKMRVWPFASPIFIRSLKTLSTMALPIKAQPESESLL
jgi:hypothetical protein